MKNTDNPEGVKHGLNLRFGHDMVLCWTVAAFCDTLGGRTNTSTQSREGAGPQSGGSKTRLPSRKHLRTSRFAPDGFAAGLGLMRSQDRPPQVMPC